MRAVGDLLSTKTHWERGDLHQTLHDKSCPLLFPPSLPPSSWSHACVCSFNSLALSIFCTNAKCLSNSYIHSYVYTQDREMCVCKIMYSIFCICESSFFHPFCSFIRACNSSNCIKVGPLRNIYLFLQSICPFSLFSSLHPSFCSQIVITTFWPFIIFRSTWQKKLAIKHFQRLFVIKTILNFFASNTNRENF